MKQSPRNAALSAFRTLALELSASLKAGNETARVEESSTIVGIQRYSDLNRLLILKQYPDASEVHGYEDWRQRGYQVRRGEKGIRIIAPHLKPGEDRASNPGFHSTVVFDRSQVDPIEPEPSAQPEQQ